MNPTSSGGRQRLAGIARAAMSARGLEPEIPAAAMAQLAHIAPAPPQPNEGVRDLRALPWASIDNDDSRDLDQLSVAGTSPSGAQTVLVAIADVDALVKKGTPIDEHAHANTTSVYTAAGVFPMLPEQLSTDLTSLNEAEDRLAIVTEMTLAPDGAVTKADIYRALVRNKAKLAYNSLAAWLDGGAMPPRLAEVLPSVPGLDEQLRTQDRIAQSMRRLRHEEGALTLQSAEARPVFVGDELTDLAIDAPNRAKELIEEFMVGANRATARFLDAHHSPSLRRVLRSPERWDRIRELAATKGDQLGPQPDSKALDAFLRKQRDADPGHFADLSLSVIKLIGRGEYAADLPGEQAPGHFGLAVQDYAHSTAPNRRFPDLVGQRLVKAALAGESPPYSAAELKALAEHCSLQEANADKVERQLRKSAAALLLATRIGDVFDAVVTGASDKGTWVRVAHPAAEGRLFGKLKGLDVGDRLQVKLKSLDVERGFIDFALAAKPQN